MILHGDNMKIMPTLDPESFQTCVTSPPYWGLRNYGVPESDWPEVTYVPMPGLPPITVPKWTGCLGLEPTPEMFVAHMVLVFREVWRLLRKDGTLWVNYGDSYAAALDLAARMQTPTARQYAEARRPGTRLPDDMEVPERWYEWGWIEPTEGQLTLF